MGRNGEKTVQHRLNDEAHSLAYDILVKDQGYYNPSTRVIDPLSSGISILFDNSTLTSKMSTFLREQLTTAPLQATICKSLIKLLHKLCNTNHQNKKY